MLAQEHPVEDLRRCEDTARIRVRSVTGSTYTLVETTTYELPFRGAVPAAARVVARTYRTAYGCLPVERNADGSFTIVDTRTRLVRVDT